MLRSVSAVAVMLSVAVVFVSLRALTAAWVVVVAAVSIVRCSLRVELHDASVKSSTGSKIS